MKPSKSSGIFEPFKHLDALLEARQIRLGPAPTKVSAKTPKKQMDHRPERAIFADAMADVKKISRSNCPAGSPAAPGINGSLPSPVPACVMAAPEPPMCF